MELMSKKMNLDFVRTFVVLGQSSNMTEASKKLGVTVSSISRHIKELEYSLDAKLVVINSKTKNTELTEIGKYFFDKYVEIYNTILLTEKEYRELNHLDSGKVSVGVCRDLEETLFKQKLKDFTNKYPNINVKVINGDTNTLIRHLTQYSIDFVLDKNMPTNESKMNPIDTKMLYKSNYCLAYNDKYFKDVSKINELPLILPINGNPDRIIIEDYFAKNNIIPNIRYELNDIDNIISYIKDGYGVAIVLKDVAENNNFNYVNLDLEANVCISYIKEKLTPSTEEFLKLF